MPCWRATAESHLPSQRSRPADEQHPRILVISDTFPDPASGGHDRQLLQILHGFANSVRKLTFAAREGVHSQACEPLLRQAGMNPYSNDAEYMPFLGYDVEASHWSLHGVLARAQFDIAILIQTFDQASRSLNNILTNCDNKLLRCELRYLPPTLCAFGRKRRNRPLDFETPKTGQPGNGKHLSAPMQCSSPAKTTPPAAQMRP